MRIEREETLTVLTEYTQESYSWLKIQRMCKSCIKPIFNVKLTFNSMGNYMCEWINSMDDLQRIKSVLCFTNKA